ncbi:MAG: 50S ribosomal protein L18 [Nannocystaceae bacterium]
MAKTDRTTARARRRKGIRLRVRGSAERPRMTVFRSNKHIYAQVIDDEAGRSLASASTLSKVIAVEIEKVDSKLAGAQAVGKAIAAACAQRGIRKVVFDRNGYRYRGVGDNPDCKPTRVAALADAAREAGLDF